MCCCSFGIVWQRLCMIDLFDKDCPLFVDFKVLMQPNWNSMVNMQPRQMGTWMTKDFWMQKTCVWRSAYNICLYIRYTSCIWVSFIVHTWHFSHISHKHVLGMFAINNHFLMQLFRDDYLFESNFKLHAINLFFWR